MTEQEIKDNAPDGATGYTHEPDYSIISYWRIVNGWAESWSSEDNSWLQYHGCGSFNDYMLSIIKPL